MGWGIYMIVGAILVAVNKKLAFAWLVFFLIFIVVRKGNVGW